MFGENAFKKVEKYLRLQKMKDIFIFSDSFILERYISWTTVYVLPVVPVTQRQSEQFIQEYANLMPSYRAAACSRSCRLLRCT